MKGCYPILDDCFHDDHDDDEMRLVLWLDIYIQSLSVLVYRVEN